MHNGWDTRYREKGTFFPRPTSFSSDFQYKVDLLETAALVEVGQLTLATIARRCAGSGKGNFAPRLQVEPLLADRLGAADVANSSEEVPSWKEVASQAEEGAEENVPLSIKERRLIEAALKPVTVLPQTPEPPRRLKIPVETGRRPYLPNSELEVLRPATSKESGPTGQASSFPTGYEILFAAADVKPISDQQKYISKDMDDMHQLFADLVLTLSGTFFVPERIRHFSG
eukprot:symbB.v1.2.031968.t1/scaffold3772.1/size50605/1